LAVVESGGTGDGALAIFLGDGKANFRKSVRYKLGAASGAVAVVDFNGDGRLDIAATNAGVNGVGGSVMVFFGRGNGAFHAPAVYKFNGYLDAIATADLNGDHIPDIVAAADGSSNVTVLMNDGRGGFKSQRTYSAAQGADGIAIADFRHNGILDLAVSGSHAVAVLLGNGDGTFGTAILYSTDVGNGDAFAVVAADFRGDGKLDLAVERVGGPSALLYGNGDGTFQTAIPIKTKINGGYSLTVGDFNKDGFPDLAMDAVAVRVGSVAVLLNAR
jgi:hypothetical protein